jgi:transcriptional regulator with XRE-family HTH domain
VDKPKDRIDVIYQRVGHQIARLRFKANQTQEQLAGKAGLSRTSIVLIERGRQRIPIDRLYRIARELEVDIKEILPSMEDVFQNFQDQENEEMPFDESIDELNASEVTLIRKLIKKGLLEAKNETKPSKKGKGNS